MKISEKITKFALEEVGVQEIGNTNCGPKVNVYKACTYLDAKEPWPWCAAFVDWVVFQAMKSDGPYTFEAPRTAGAWALEDWSLKQDKSTWTKKNPGADIKAGDIVIFKMSHVGLAVEDAKSTTVKTVEGNTNEGGSREGQGVYAKSRKLTMFKTRIRFTV